MHIDHVLWLMGAEGELRDAGQSSLSRRIRFWANQWPAAPIQGPDIMLLQGVIDAGWTVKGIPREGLDVMTPKEHLAMVVTRLSESPFFEHVRTEPPLHEGHWWRVNFVLSKGTTWQDLIMLDCAVFLGYAEPVSRLDRAEDSPAHAGDEASAGPGTAAPAKRIRTHDVLVPSGHTHVSYITGSLHCLGNSATPGRGS